MIKALLVDDDYLVRSYLKMLPSWQEAGVEIKGDVRDGEEALEVLETTSVELLVTDLAMPLMDGIELIKAVKRKYPEMYIIVLSCHDDFDSVKRAMQEGADEYVLKNTLNEKSLYTLLMSTVKKIDEKSENASVPDIVEEKKENTNDVFLFFNQILSGMLSKEEREEVRIKAGIKGTYQNSAVIILKLDPVNAEADFLTEFEQGTKRVGFLKKLQNIMEQTAEEYEFIQETLHLGNGIYCSFLDLSECYKASVMHQKLTSAASVCYKFCRKEHKSFTVGVSNICIGQDAIRQAYQQARMMVKTGFYEKNAVIYYEMNGKVGSTLPSSAEKLIEKLPQLKYGQDIDTYEKLSKAVVEDFKKELTEGTIVMHWLKCFLVACGDGESLQQSIQSIDEVSNCLQEEKNHLFKVQKEELPENLSKPVRIAVEYLNAHYKEPISLNDAAERAGVNSSYLSFLFSQEMKIGFAGYLLNLRLEHAKKMLKESHLKMCQIAEQSGFNDYHYFSKVFKKNSGVSPAEYRKEVNKQ